MAMYRQVYFQGTDNKLWGINLNGTDGVNIGGYETASPPVVFGDYIYFQGTDDKLWKVKQDGSDGTNLGGYKTSPPPVLPRVTYIFRESIINFGKYR